VRRLLRQGRSLDALRRALARGALGGLAPPPALRSHIVAVYARVERAAGPASPAAWPLKLTALVHEEPPARVGRVLARAGLAGQSRFVRGIVASFGEIWKARDGRALAAFARRHRRRLRPLLLFEVAHEGAATAAMRDVARRGGIERVLASWLARLAPGAGRRARA